uniref:Uncharacterized protein n=1 Tax=Arion vulgaris TaxID=1028688 RepID=A0A0B7BNK5_9EUPU
MKLASTVVQSSITPTCFTSMKYLIYAVELFLYARLLQLGTKGYLADIPLGNHQDLVHPPAFLQHPQAQQETRM